MDNIISTHCRLCNHETNHSVLSSERSTLIHEIAEDERLEDHTDFMIIQCMGCDYISFLMRSSGSFFDGNIFDVHYPKDEEFSELSFLKMDDQNVLPQQLKTLYKQLQVALNHDLTVLSGIGLRMTIEAICLDQEISGNNLKIKIDNLHHNGLISKNKLPIIHKLRDMGNMTAHEIKAYSIDVLKYALDIVNHILISIYILPHLNEKLQIS